MTFHQLALLSHKTKVQNVQILYLHINDIRVIIQTLKNYME